MIHCSVKKVDINCDIFARSHRCQIETTSETCFCLWSDVDVVCFVLVSTWLSQLRRSTSFPTCETASSCWHFTVKPRREVWTSIGTTSCATRSDWRSTTSKDCETLCSSICPPNISVHLAHVWPTDLILSRRHFAITFCVCACVQLWTVIACGSSFSFVRSIIQLPCFSVGPPSFGYWLGIHFCSWTRMGSITFTTGGGTCGVSHKPHEYFWIHRTRAYRVVQKRIPSFIFGITSVIQHRF